MRTAAVESSDGQHLGVILELHRVEGDMLYGYTVSAPGNGARNDIGQAIGLYVVEDRVRLACQELGLGEPRIGELQP